MQEDAAVEEVSTCRQNMPFSVPSCGGGSKGGGRGQEGRALDFPSNLVS